MKDYKAPWGRSLVAISTIGTILCLGVALSLLLHGQGWLRWMSLVPLGLLLGSALFAIRGYTITSDAILIHRLFWPTRLPLAGVQSAWFEPQAMRWSVRTFGNGGLFCFTGYYRNKALGAYRAFVTDLNKTVVLRYPGRTIVISPDPSESFVNSVQALPIVPRAR